jgi:hypothetical protein
MVYDHIIDDFSQKSDGSTLRYKLREDGMSNLKGARYLSELPALVVAFLGDRKLYLEISSLGISI